MKSSGGATTRLARWGASLAVRIPKPIVEQWRVEEGTLIEVVPSGREVILKRRRHDLDKLVGAITPENRHGEVDWGERQGREEW